MESLPEKAEGEWAAMIACSHCLMPLAYEEDTFGPPGYPLCLDCHSAALDDNGMDFYRNRSLVMQVKFDFARDCPQCHYPMEVGLADWTANVKCPVCGYEETHQFYDWVGNDWMDE